MEPGLADVPLFTNGARDTVTERQTDFGTETDIGIQTARELVIGIIHASR